MKLPLPALKISQQTALKIHYAVILTSAVCLFLPYYVVSALLMAGAGFILLTPFLRQKILIYKGSVMAFVFLTVTGTVAAVNGNMTGLRRTCVFAAMMIVTIAARSFSTRDYFEKTLDFICIGGCGSTVVSIIEYVIHRDVAHYRSQAFFTNPNFFGTALTLVILICAYKAATVTNHAIVYYAVAVFNAIGLFLSGSMSLWLVAFVGIMLTLIFTKRYRLLAIFLSVAVAAVAIILLVPGMIPRLNELSATIDNRKAIWSFAIENIKDSPIFGRGFYTYKFLYNRLCTVQEIYPAAMAHSVILDSLLCHGIVGVTLIGITLVQFFRSVFACRKQLKAQSKPSPISGFIIAVSIAVACYGLMDTTFIWVQTGMILMLISSGLGVEEREI